MKKKTLFIIMVALLGGNVAMSQDTLKLFGNHKNRDSERRERSIERNKGEIQTLTGPGRNLGFYFGFTTGYSQVDHCDAFSAGATLAMIANHGLAIGFSGKGFISEPYKLAGVTNTSYNYAGGYGGLLIEPIVMPKSPVHVSFPILLGVGGITRNRLVNTDYPYDYADVYIEDVDAFLIAEPGIELELNVTRWMRLAIGGSYRITTSLGPGVSNPDALNGFTAGLSMKFGMF